MGQGQAGRQKKGGEGTPRGSHQREWRGVRRGGAGPSARALFSRHLGVPVVLLQLRSKAPPRVSPAVSTTGRPSRQQPGHQATAAGAAHSCGHISAARRSSRRQERRAQAPAGPVQVAASSLGPPRLSLGEHSEDSLAALVQSFGVRQQGEERRVLGVVRELHGRLAVIVRQQAVSVAAGR